MINNIIISILFSLVLIGCSTIPTERAKGISTSGKEYVEVLKQVNNLALDKSIDFTTEIFPNLPRTQEVLISTTDEIRKRSELIDQADEYYSYLANYFDSLEALAKGDQSEATSNALAQIADTLKKEPIDLKLSDEKKKSLTGLTSFVAKQAHSSAVEKALKRDADTIAQSLALTEKMLDEQIKWITLRERLIRDKEFIDKVQKPYISGAPLTPEWKKTWSSHVRKPPIIALLNDTKKASEEMQKSWINILRGQYSYDETIIALNNIKAGVEAIKALKESN